MILFETPGLIDVRAFTTMGLTAKPNSRNPIGYFGTGLKYAIATLVRLGAEPIVWIGNDEYRFLKRSDEFRGKPYDALVMRRRKASLFRFTSYDLPFTTEYGRNWEAWMAFRELESNTRDEKGETFRIDPNLYGDPRMDAIVNDDPPHSVVGRVGFTRIVVDLPAFEEAYAARDATFLPGAIREGSGVQVVRGEGKHLYWRSLRVLDLQKPSLFTYNFLDHLQLTEDRTLYSGDYYARSALAQHVSTCDDEDLIERVITATEDDWEHELEFNRYDAPSAAFRRVMMRHPKGASTSSWAYYGRHDDRPAPKEIDLFEKHPRPWRVSGDAIVDAAGVRVVDCPYDYDGRWEKTAAKVLERMNASFDQKVQEVEGESYDHAGDGPLIPAPLEGSEEEPAHG